MKKILLALTVALAFTLTACTNDSDPCGEGTSLVDGVCVLDGGNNNTNNPTEAVSCSAETGLHTVPGGKTYTITSFLSWNIIGWQNFADPDNAWIMDFGAALFEVHTPFTYAWEASYSKGGMFLTKGCEYTFEYTLRTEAPNLKPTAIVFADDTNGYTFFEETVPLTTESNTFRFTVVPTESTYINLGVYFGDTTGMIIIEEIQIERSEISE